MTTRASNTAASMESRVSSQRLILSNKSFWLSAVVCLLWITPTVQGLKHNFFVKRDARTFIGPIGAPYGFLEGGCFGLDVFDFKLTVGRKRHPKKKNNEEAKAKAEAILNSVEAGLVLKRFKSESEFSRFEEAFLSNSSLCVFDPFRASEGDQIFEEDDEFGTTGEIMTAGTDGIYLPLRQKQVSGDESERSPQSINYMPFKQEEAGLYFLMYQVCPKRQINSPVSLDYAEIRSTFELDFHYKNFDALGNESYLTAGEMPLPTIFFFFSVSYALCFFVWFSNIRSIRAGGEGHFGGSGTRPVVFPIHHLMTVLMLLKTLSVFFESVRYHYVRLSGHSEFWSVVYFTFNFLKGTFLFTVILLIGSGWSFVKPFLSNREKKIVFAVLVLQIIDNIVLAILAQEAEGESVYDDWSAVLHIVDILCCCAVLIPIVWQVNTMEASLEGDEADTAPTSDTARTVAKLKLFRSFYCAVVCYIYFTRIVVYIFATWLDYRHTWVRYFVTELATLVFYVVTGLSFRPMSDNPYLAVQKDDEKAEATSNEDQVEMGAMGDSKSS